jgi:DNA-binding winged helix-turn-helix (wHTH) protein
VQAEQSASAMAVVIHVLIGNPPWSEPEQLARARTGEDGESERGRKSGERWGKLGGNLETPLIARFDPFVLDLERRQLTRDGAGVRLTPMAFNLLALLIGEAPRVVTKQELHDHLWPRTFVSDATLLGLVKEVRRALDDRDVHAIIRTSNRVGYAFAAPVVVTPDRSSVRHWLLVGAQRVALQTGANVIGRDSDAAVWLDAASVSRRHAQIVVDSGDAHLEDLGSKNGTKLGDVPVTTRVALKDGDRISVGVTTLVYRVASSPEETQTHAG